jgi:hypothetical protein
MPVTLHFAANHRAIEQFGASNSVVVPFLL